MLWNGLRTHSCRNERRGIIQGCCEKTNEKRLKVSHIAGESLDVFFRNESDEVSGAPRGASSPTRGCRTIGSLWERKALLDQSVTPNLLLLRQLASQCS